MTTHAPTASSKKDVCCNRNSGTEEQDHSRLQSIIDTVLKKCVSSKVLIFVVNKKINKEQ